MPPIFSKTLTQTQSRFAPQPTTVAGTATPSFELSQSTAPAQLHFYQVPASLLPKIKEVQARVNDYLKATYQKMLADFEADTIEMQHDTDQATLFAVHSIINVMEWYSENLARFKAWREAEVADARQKEAIWQETAETAWAENQAMREALEHIAKLKTVGEVRAAVKEALK